MLAADTSLWTDDVWVVDSTPVECGRSRETARRSDLAGWAEYGYCASHSRYFWGLRLHLVATLHGLPVAFALAGAKADEREVLLGMLAAGPDLLAARPGQTLIGDKNYYGRGFEAAMADAGIRLLRPARKGEPARAGAHLFKPLRQIIESVNDTFKGQLDLERHGGHTPAGVMVRVLQRILALTAAIWHNDTPASPSCGRWWLTTTDLGIDHPDRLRLIPPRLLGWAGVFVQVSASPPCVGHVPEVAMVSRITWSVPVTVNDVLDGHVQLDLDCLDRLYLHGYLGQLQVGGRVIQFLQHRGYPVPSPACLQQMGTPSGAGLPPSPKPTTSRW